MSANCPATYTSPLDPTFPSNRLDLTAAMISDRLDLFLKFSRMVGSNSFILVESDNDSFSSWLFLFSLVSDSERWDDALGYWIGLLCDSINVLNFLNLL